METKSKDLPSIFTRNKDRRVALGGHQFLGLGGPSSQQQVEELADDHRADCGARPPRWAFSQICWSTTANLGMFLQQTLHNLLGQAFQEILLSKLFKNDKTLNISQLYRDAMNFYEITTSHPTVYTSNPSGPSRWLPFAPSPGEREEALLLVQPKLTALSRWLGGVVDQQRKEAGILVPGSDAKTRRRTSHRFHEAEARGGEANQSYVKWMPKVQVVRTCCKSRKETVVKEIYSVKVGHQYLPRLKPYNVPAHSLVCTTRKEWLHYSS